ncbi:MAG: FkbM family methyltransferase [Candidatus Omnitrophica bacterium]|nr:FkbM family methyltransferase [Candidatus Omnitrophota bacterium]
MKEELKEGMRVLDIGANIGYYSLLLASIVGPTGKVYSIEPSSQNFRLLKENIALNHAENIVDVFHMGVSDKVSSENLYLSIHSNSHSFFRGTLHSKKTEKGEGETEPVEMTDVDSFVKGKEPIHFIRMDVEGFEVKVFQGMKSFIENSSNEIKILFEVHRSRYDEKDFNMREQLTRLFKLGFVPKTLIAKPLLKSKPYGIYPFSERGYSPDFLIPTDGFQRGYYTNISQNDVLDYVCSLGCVRALLLVRMPQAATQRETSYSRLSE